MPRPALHEQFVPGIVKKGKTNCVCSGAHCAAVGGFAALRMRRAPLRVVSALYRAIQPREGAGAPRASLMCHCEERSDVAISGRQLRFRRWLSCDLVGYCEIATSACGLLAMTRQGSTAVHQRPRAVKWPCTRRSVTAATNAIGAYRFIGSRYESSALRRGQGIRKTPAGIPPEFMAFFVSCLN